ncbi:hypothetical protein ABBQ32_010180 [Trebouxia sp. C0010 RCD-2024]
MPGQGPGACKSSIQHQAKPRHTGSKQHPAAPAKRIIVKLSMKASGTGQGTVPQQQARHIPDATIPLADQTPVPNASVPTPSPSRVLSAKPFRVAPVERPVTRRFSLQQHSNLKLRIKLKRTTPPTNESPQRMSTLKHQQKRQRQQASASPIKHDSSSPTPAAVQAGHLVQQAASCAVRIRAPAESHVEHDQAPAVPAASASIPQQCSAAAMAWGQLTPAPVAARGKCIRLCPLHSPTSSSVATAAEASPLPVAAVVTTAESAYICASRKSELVGCQDELGLTAQTHRADTPAACTKQTPRGVKRPAPMAHYATPPTPPPAPYKLVRVGLAATLLPAVVHSTATAGLGFLHAKRRRGGGGSSGPVMPWSMLTPGYAHNQGQRLITARSLFHPVVGGVALQEQVVSGQCVKRMSLDERQKEQRAVLQCVLQHQTAAMQSFKLAVLAGGTQARRGSGVSYVIPSASQQEVLAVNLPLKDDATVKEYLLHPQLRASLLLSQGAIVSSIQGTQALQPLLSSRSFVCLHYRLGAGGTLQPCTADPSSSDAATHSTNPAWSSIQGSTVQVGLQIRKGVGGTCPARAAARSPALQSVLTALAVSHAASETMAPPQVPHCTAEAHGAPARLEHHTQQAQQAQQAHQAQHAQQAHQAQHAQQAQQAHSLEAQHAQRTYQAQHAEHTPQQPKQAQWPAYQQQQQQPSLEHVVIPTTSTPALPSDTTVAGLAGPPLHLSSHAEAAPPQAATTLYTSINAAAAAAAAVADAAATPVHEVGAGCLSADTGSAGFAASHSASGNRSVAAAAATAAVASAATSMTVNKEDPKEGLEGATALGVVQQQTDAQMDEGDPGNEKDVHAEALCNSSAAAG